MKKRYLIVSFMSTRFNLLKEHWGKHNNLKKQDVFGSNLRSNLPKPPNLGGKIFILDWDTKEIVWEYLTDVPTGIIYENNNIIFTNLQREIKSVSGEKIIIRSVKKNIFNNLHSISKTNNGYLITATGLDLILETNFKGEILWSWYATLNGFDETPLKEKREIIDTDDYYSINFPTLSQTTHLNSAIEVNGKIYTTLFHQGILLSIDKETHRTQVLCEHLSKPHSIRQISDSRFILSDTLNNQVIIFDKDFKIISTIKDNFNWVQTVVEIKNGNFLIADADNCRIIEFSLEKQKQTSQYLFDKNLRIFDLLDISEDDYKNFIN